MNDILVVTIDLVQAMYCGLDEAPNGFVLDIRSRDLFQNIPQFRTGECTMPNGL